MNTWCGNASLIPHLPTSPAHEEACGLDQPCHLSPGQESRVAFLQPQVARTEAALAAPLGLSDLFTSTVSWAAEGSSRESWFRFVITGVLEQLLKPLGSGTFHAGSVAISHGGVALGLVLCSILLVTQSL